jgi:hypothetical protein
MCGARAAPAGSASGTGSLAGKLSSKALSRLRFVAAVLHVSLVIVSLTMMME